MVQSVEVLVVGPLGGVTEGEFVDVVVLASDKCGVVGILVCMFRSVAWMPAVSLYVFEVQGEGLYHAVKRMCVYGLYPRFVCMAELRGRIAYWFSMKSYRIEMDGVGWKVIWSCGIALNCC